MRLHWTVTVGRWQCRVAGFGLVCMVLAFAPTSAGAAKKNKPNSKSSKSDTRPVTPPKDAATPTTRRAIDSVPDPASIAEADRLVRGVFKEAYAAAAPATAPTTSPVPATLPAFATSTQPATSPTTAPSNQPTLVQRQSNFAQRFYRQALMAEDDPAERYVLLRDSRDFAAAAGDSVTAMRAVGRMQDLFAIDPMEIHDAALNALTTASRAASTPGAIEDNCRAFLQLIEAALAIGDVDLARRASIAAKPASERGTNPLLADLIKSYTPQAGLEQDAATAQTAIERLQANPDSAGDNLTAGRFLCFARGNWDIGLLMLARGSDQVLKELASTDLASPEPSARADAWWDAAEKQKGRIHRGMRLRAGYWYTRAWPTLTSEARNQAVTRMRAITSAVHCPGLLADLYDGENFERYAAQRIDPSIDFDWKTGPPDAHLGSEHFSICWQGTLHPPQAGKYEFEGAADDGVVITIGKQTIADQWQKGNGPFHTAIDLTGAREPLWVFYRQGGGHSAVRLHWKPPGEEKMVTIPATVFSHDPVWPWGSVAYATNGRGQNASVCITGGGADAQSVWFSRVAQQLPWHAAKRYCQQHGGHLAWVRHPAQNNVLMQLVGGEPTWIGGSDDDAEGWWTWTDGSHFDPAVLYWGEGEPEGGRNENYAAIEKNKGWADWPGRHPFICQWDR